MVEKDILKDIKFLSDLPDQVIEKIAAMATLEIHEQDTILFHQGQNLMHMYMLISGKVHFTVSSASGKSLILDKILEGRTFGVYALMEESSSIYSAICAEKSTIVSIPGKQMHQLFEEDFKIGHID